MPLQRETVARAALHVVDEVGLDGLTMRRLAADLEIQNQSLYWHFTNKQELINCMAELMIAEAFAELQHPGSEQDWADWLTAFAHRFRRTMLAHRDGARILAEADMSLSNFFEGLELALDVLLNAGFDENTATGGVITVIHFILGNVFQVQADPSSRVDGEDEQSPHAPMVPFDEERFPRIAAVLHTSGVPSQASAEVQFEAGLSLILDGLRANLAKERSNGTSR
ncbi:MAG TPA: TetR/AcrR family transcriptional regulator C-terminal domain-containing protein [Ktedonobacteraceae bacterium]